MNRIELELDRAKFRKITTSFADAFKSVIGQLKKPSLDEGEKKHYQIEQSLLTSNQCTTTLLAILKELQFMNDQEEYK